MFKSFLTDHPRGPATLRGAGYRVVLDLRAEIFELGPAHEIRYGVHRPQRGLYHRETDQPIWLGWVVQEMRPRKGDYAIFSSGLFQWIGRKCNMLIGDLKKNGWGWIL